MLRALSDGIGMRRAAPANAMPRALSALSASTSTPTTTHGSFRGEAGAVTTTLMSGGPIWMEKGGSASATSSGSRSDRMGSEMATHRHYRGGVVGSATPIAPCSLGPAAVAAAAAAVRRYAKVNPHAIKS